MANASRRPRRCRARSSARSTRCGWKSARRCSISSSARAAGRRDGGALLTPLLVFEQLLNGVQFGVMLFLMAAGLTLVFGIMNVVNLAHGSLYMIGAYVCAETYDATGSFALAIPSGLAAALATGVVIEIGIFRVLYARDHLDQVLATFGLTLFFNDLVRVIWGSTAVYATVPRFLAGQVHIITGAPYPAYRLAVIVVGFAVAALLYLVISHTRFGMVVRAGASNRVMAGALGANIVVLYTVVFALGAM